MTARVYTIPPAAPFLTSLAQAVLVGGFPTPATPAPGPLDLPRWTILVPTRRAARALHQAFLDVSPARAQLLPRIKPLGDVDEDALDDASIDDLDIPPALDPLAREFLLIGLIRDWAQQNPHEPLARELIRSPARMMSVSQSLCGLIDGFETEEVDVNAIADLFAGDFAAHRTAILSFLAIIRIEFPAALLRLGMLGPAQRQRLVLEREAERLAKQTNGFPVIAAGSTGSIPATARLLQAIANLDRGAVILPGLDLAMDEASWAVLGPQHAQFGMKMLLSRLEIERSAVTTLPGISPTVQDRVWLTSEIMRPTPATGQWREVIAAGRARIASGIEGVDLFEAANRHEEAAAIALMMREALETKGRTAALITPDRDLARRVKAELGRWQVEVDDSAGDKLMRTPPGSLITLLLDGAQSQFSAIALSALIHHPMVGEERAARMFETAVLRHQRLRPGLGGLQAAVALADAAAHGEEFVHPLVRRMTGEDWRAVRKFAAMLARRLEPLETIAQSQQPLGLTQVIETIVTCVQGFAGDDLWAGDAGEVLSSLLAAMLRNANHLPALSFECAAAILYQRLRTAPVVPAAPAHPRLQIYGLLEARLIEADIKILGGLNEGIWPGHPDTGPWLNRPMRDTLRLQPPERQIGLTAHDFAQAFAAAKVFLTWSRRLEDSPAVASRWVLRLKMLLESAKAPLRPTPWKSWAAALDRPAQVKPVGKPAPRPPVEARPKRLSVTRIETLIRDPYAVFARSILRLEMLPDIAAKPDMAARGSLVHDALHRFCTKYPSGLPVNAEEELIAAGREVFQDVMDDPDAASFWWPRFLRIAHWFVGVELELRSGVIQILTEVKGQIDIPLEGDSFTLTARADRIDVLADGSARIVDYKTGEPPSKPQVERGLSPQLTLEAAMLARGGFAGVAPVRPSSLLYVKLSGGEPPGRLASATEDDPEALAEAHLEKLTKLLTAYRNPQQPYLPRAAHQYEDAALDYDHLSRFKEWSLAGKGR